MKHVKITAFDIPDAWFQVVKRIYEEGEFFPVKYGSEVTNTKKLDVTIEILHPENKPLLHEKAPCDMKYVQGYALEYLWFSEKKPDETYTYASRLREPVDQVKEAINRFAEEPYDRQVTLVIRRPEDIFKELEGKRHEPPCLTLVDLEIGSVMGKYTLFTTRYWRSWDAYAALPANIAGMQIADEAFVKQLNERGIEKHGDKWNHVSTGKMIHHSKNCHLYERQYPFVEKLLKASNSSFAEKIMTNSSSK